MRKITPLLIILFVAMYSCKKTNTGNTNNPPPPPPPGNGSDLKINTISPLRPYPGDVITITGTGFDTDITKDTVLVGITVNNAFEGQVNVNVRHTKIISATATEIKFVTDSAIQVVPAGLKVGLWIGVPGKRYFTPDNPIDIKYFSFNFTSVDPYPIPCGAIFAGDSLFFKGRGFYKPCTVYINGKVFPINFDADNTTIGRGFLPVDFFGDPGTIPCTASQHLDVKVVNGDGKTLSIKDNFYPGPNSQLTGVSLDAASYSLSTSNNALLKLTGYAMRSDWYIRINGKDNNTGVITTKDLILPITGFPNEFTQSLDLLALPNPDSNLGVDYTIQFKGGVNGSFAFPVAWFTLYK